MIDFRFKTFLTLCKTKSYTKAAQKLNITQPAVTQHIKYLEEKYDTKLFQYSGKILDLTPEGETLKDIAKSIQVDSEKAYRILKDKKESIKRIKFGATLTIGEYMMPELIEKYMADFPDSKVTMIVENTDRLLHMLREGDIDFAFIEGYFNKLDYNYKIFSKEEFVVVCSTKNHLAGKSVILEDILKENIIIREQGSGTRNIFETALYEHNMQVEGFKNVTEIGNINVIKKLVQKNLGLTFIYKKAVQKELKKGTLSQIYVEDFKALRQFNFVTLKNSMCSNEYEKFLNYYNMIINTK
ncbi:MULTISPECIES: LysR family transcriptional regulator [Clostridium]|uniref:DNA-binding transcriptional regulator, LysR family n=1 Tax=Clostridium cadaveris TaxID=1529 RepID=A0A1I2M1K8_9CLOT|nr:LysR family transcriptional regulator [Clostridium cadaveris]MDM8312878.1 LysR family transcriptional regulator [Clostridium cadaveris]MDU4950765.1 LysR family transcriptional regulator [Clostridium sp.]NME63679.1 LysR family transcriptional regulator [Clostridium cadaveris]SFF84678.1 DNA-binding transcriptional regulator, LysR family [Clostridium cadaveris]